MTISTLAPVLNVRGLCFSYPGERPLFQDFSMAVAPGLTLLHGDTGSGKSTLLRVLAGLLPALGDIELEGLRLQSDPIAYRNKLSFRDPDAPEVDAIVAREAVAQASRDDKAFDSGRFDAMAEGFGLRPHLEKPIYMLSTGSRRKLWLAAVLASGRRLVLLDEPSAALDAASVRCLWSTLAAFASRGDGRAVLIASAGTVDLPLAGRIDLS